MRYFIALPLPGPAREALARILSPLRSDWPRLRWVAPEAYHLTLVFLGEIEGPAVGCAERALEAAARGFRFGFSIPGLGFLPTRGAPRVLYARLEERPEGSSARLHSLINEALAFEAVRAGLPSLNAEWAGLRPLNAVAEVSEGAGAEARTFKAHITLARLATGAAIPARGALGGAAVSGEWTIDRCVLYSSKLRPAGAVYTEMRSVALLPP